MHDCSDIFSTVLCFVFYCYGLSAVFNKLMINDDDDLDRKSYMSFRLVPKSSAEGPRDATGILYNCEVEIL